MNCPNCNRPVAPGTKFCAACGTPIPQDAPVAPQPPVNDAPAPRPAGKGPSRKPILIGALSAVAVVLVAVLVFLWVGKSTPEDKVQKAMEKSSEALEEHLDQMENFSKLTDQVAAIGDKGDYTMTMRVEESSTYGDYSSSTNFDYVIDYSQKNKAMGLTANIGVDNGDETVNMGLKGYLDEKSLQLGMPDVLDDIYGIPLENLSAALEDSYLGQMLDLELDGDFSLNLFSTEPDPKVQERLDAFTDTIKATPREGKETLELDKERQCTAYDITFGTKELEKLLETLVDPDVNPYTALMTEYSMNELLDELYIEEIVDVLGDVELTYFVDDRGYFVGCDITYDDETLCLRLTGSKNPWEEIRLYPEDMEDEALIITLDVDDDGMDLKVKMEGETLFRLKYEDSDGAISLEAGGEKMPSEWKINLVMDDKAPSFSLEYSETGSSWSETVSFYLGIAPLENEPKPLGDSYENILEMDEADFEDLMWEIQEKLFDNSNSSSDVVAEPVPEAAETP